MMIVISEKEVKMNLNNKDKQIGRRLGIWIWFLSILFIPQITLFAQGPDTLWTRMYYNGTGEYGHGFAVQQTSDGGYICAGYMKTFEVSNCAGVLIKVDSAGNTIWKKTFDTIESDMFYDMLITTDGNYVMTGKSDYDVWLVKADSGGNTLWIKTYNGSSGNSVAQTSDGGYIITGTESIEPYDIDVLLIKTDASGDALWTTTFLTGGGSDYGQCVIQTTDNGYIIAGQSDSFGHGYDGLLIKTDSLGTQTWMKYYGGLAHDVFKSILQVSDGYIIAGGSQSFGKKSQHKVWLVKTDFDGTTLWTKTFGGDDIDVGYSVRQTTDGGYIITGNTMSFAPGVNAVYLIKTDALGDTLWTRTYASGGSSQDIGKDVQQTSNGGYIIVGSGMPETPGSYGFYLIKTKPQGPEIEENAKSKVKNAKCKMQISPNPFSKSTVISYSSLVGSTELTEVINDQLPVSNDLQCPALRIYDAAGRLVKQFDHKTIGLSNRVAWNGTDDLGRRLPAGVYFLQLETEELNQTKKVVLLY